MRIFLQCTPLWWPRPVTYSKPPCSLSSVHCVHCPLYTNFVPTKFPPTTRLFDLPYINHFASCLIPQRFKIVVVGPHRPHTLRRCEWAVQKRLNRSRCHSATDSCEPMQWLAFDSVHILLKNAPFRGRAGFSWWGAWGPGHLGSLSGIL